MTVVVKSGAFDVAEFKRAYESWDLEALVALYATDVEVTDIGRDHGPSTPRTRRGREVMQGMFFQRVSERMCESTSSPLMYGIMRSSSTTDTSGSRSSASIASRPSPARVTSKGPCSSFILMMRPMCGSSSATSTCTGTMGVSLIQRVRAKARGV